MTRHVRFVIVGVALVAASASGWAVQGSASQPQATPAETAAKASPDLVGALSKELGSTPEQAAGAAGALFGVAKTRLKPEEFAQVSNAVPGMDALLAAVPAPATTSGVAASAAAGVLAPVAGSATGLASATNAFIKLGLKPEMVAKAVPVLTSFVSKSGGAGVGSLLAGVLK